MRNILIATDLTGDSEHALSRAIQLSKLSAARLHVLHVAHSAHVPGKPDETTRLMGEIKDRVRSLVTRPTTGSAVDCEVHIESRGRVYDAVCHHARKTHADLIVIGRSVRTRSVPGSVLLTTGQVIAIAHCPVLVVTRPVLGNYRQVFLEARLSHRPEKLLTPVRDFGPDITLRVIAKDSEPSAERSSILGRLQAKWWYRKRDRFRARATRYLNQRGILADRVMIDLIEHDYDAALIRTLNDEDVELVVVNSMHHALRHTRSVNPFLAAMQEASCDILSVPKV